jgi:hypothetical protein
LSELTLTAANQKLPNHQQAGNAPASADDRCLPLVIEIGGTAVRVNTADPQFLSMLLERYSGFIATSDAAEDDAKDDAEIEFDVELVASGFSGPNAEVRVTQDRGHWSIERGDFRAEWNPATRTGRIRQLAKPYSLDSVLRIVHTLVLAPQGGFLLHAASAIRNGKAFLFAGVSGAGKSTISSFAPADATLLTDEISYVRPYRDGYLAFGTPFTGELDKQGENISAPVAALYLLAKGPENRIDPVSPADAARSVLSNILFFAEDEALVHSIFHSSFQFAGQTPVSRLTFVPDARVWELIG